VVAHEVEADALVRCALDPLPRDLLAHHEVDERRDAFPRALGFQEENLGRLPQVMRVRPIEGHGHDPCIQGLLWPSCT
jgi:hypothetical protein